MISSRQALYWAVPQPWQLRCTECERLAREFQDAWRSDQEDVCQTMSFESLQGARYPRVAEVRRKWAEHEALSGHSALKNGWRGAFIFYAVVRGGYRGFLRGSGSR